jgi:gamma-glutamyltranspeptidase/glutathione hydrolase
MNSEGRFKMELKIRKSLFGVFVLMLACSISVAFPQATIAQTPKEILASELGNRPIVQVWGTGGMTASMHTEPTQAAVDILQHGGNAVDAAIALASALSVTAPDMSGPGGDTAWLIYWAKTRQFYYLDGYSKVPAAVTPAVLEQRFNLDCSVSPVPEACQEEPTGGIRSSGIIVSMTPGTPAAWLEMHKRFGTIPLHILLDRAIDLAENGFPINRNLANSLGGSKNKLAQFESSRKIFFKSNGIDPLEEGETLIQKDLGKTLRRLATGGEKAFYRGPTAEKFVKYSKTHGGLYTLKDLRDYEAIWRPVQKADYRGFDVFVAGPPTSGIHMLQELAIVENFDMASYGYHSPESLHILIEAAKLARADRREFAGDPDYIQIPIEQLLNKQYAAQRAALIEFGKAKCASPGLESVEGETSHFVVIDQDGNIVSTTQTLGSGFGCGEVVDGTGLTLNNRTWWMALKDSPNIVAPGHRANIGHSPTMVFKDRMPFMALGSPGGDGIIQYVMQTIVNVVDYGLNIQEAIESPRFRSTDLCYKVTIERRISEATRTTLKNWGHVLSEGSDWPSVGGVDGFYIHPETGNILGGYDPRNNSMARGVLRKSTRH